MNKTQKKCFLASAGIHLLLFLVLLVGPAFLIHSEKVEDMPVLDFIPEKLVDEALSGGGKPNVQPPPSQPVVKQPIRQPVQTVQKKEKTPTKTEPPKEESKSWKATSANDIKIPTTRKVTKTDTKTQQQKDTQSTAEDFKRAARDILEANKAISIETPSLGPGGGPAYANYAQAIKSIYERNWYPPSGTTRDQALVKVRIVIAKDGTVISAERISSSGDPSIDGTVNDTLKRVKKVPPFPAGAKESTRTYIIGFNLLAKLTI